MELLPTPLHPAPVAEKQVSGFRCPYVYASEAGGHDASMAMTEIRAGKGLVEEGRCGRLFDSSHAYKASLGDHCSFGALFMVCSVHRFTTTKNTSIHFILHHVDPALGGYKHSSTTLIRPVPTEDDFKHVLIVHPKEENAEDIDRVGWVGCIDNGTTDTCDPALVETGLKYEPFLCPGMDPEKYAVPPPKARSANPNSNSSSNSPKKLPSHTKPLLNRRISAGSCKKPEQFRKYLRSVPTLQPCPHTKPHIKHQKHACPWIQQIPTNEPNGNPSFVRCEEAFALSYNLKVHYYAAHHDIYIQKYHPDSLNTLVNDSESRKLMAICPVCQCKELPDDLNRHWITEHVDKALGGFDLEGRSLQSDFNEYYDKHDLMVLRVLGGFRWKRNGPSDENSDSEGEGKTVSCGSNDGCGGLCAMFGGREKTHPAVMKFFKKPENDENSRPSSSVNWMEGLSEASPSLPASPSEANGLVEDLDLDAILKDIAEGGELDTKSRNPTPVPASVTPAESSTSIVTPITVPINEAPETALTSVTKTSKRKRELSSSGAPDATNCHISSLAASPSMSEPHASPVISEAASSRHGSRSQKITPPSTDESQNLHIPSPQSAASTSASVSASGEAPQLALAKLKLKVKPPQYSDASLGCEKCGHVFSRNDALVRHIQAGSCKRKK
ncbi:UNVERIFIED_CONTAM: hypothetical protein HDU68_000605 [Siphonaria sp. JEL0065]|nr:hypothetical protein HDU68_000605 [Siphonaria sp. JEL0065]